MPGLKDFGFPPFTRAVKVLVFVNVAIFIAMFALQLTAASLYNQAMVTFALLPSAVIHGWIWQLITYSFIHIGPAHIFFNMLTLWMFGATLERDWGMARFNQFYFFCVVGAALSTIALSYSHILGMSPNGLTAGASGGIYGLIVAFGILYAEQRVYVYGIFAIKAKWLAVIWVALALFGAVDRNNGGVANVAHLGGALFGYLYLKALPKRGLSHATSEGYYGIRNRFQKWKRRRAAKKFEVFVREHDRSKYFDQYGNYRGPDSKDDSGKNDDPWVN